MIAVLRLRLAIMTCSDNKINYLNHDGKWGPLFSVITRHDCSDDIMLSYHQCHKITKISKNDHKKRRNLNFIWKQRKYNSYRKYVLNLLRQNKEIGWFMVLNATFNNISLISWRSVLLVEETGVPWENHRPVASHWHTLSHNVVSSTPRNEGIQIWKV